MPLKMKKKRVMNEKMKYEYEKYADEKYENVKYEMCEKKKYADGYYNEKMKKKNY